MKNAAWLVYYESKRMGQPVSAMRRPAILQAEKR
jgi:hypothetical protein